MNFSINQLSDSSLVIAFDQIIDPKILDQVLYVANILKSKNISGVREITNSYSSLGVYFDPIKTDYFKIKKELETTIGLLEENEYSTTKKNFIIIPVCYDFIVAPDLRNYLDKKNLSKEEFIQKHTIEEYLVYMKGFLPGFVYLGGLDKALALKRKDHPSLKVPKGSIAIGGQQTGIYGIESPGGWWVIGKSFLCFFDADDNHAIQIKAGDILKFISITIEEFKEQGGNL